MVDGKVNNEMLFTFYFYGIIVIGDFMDNLKAGELYNSDKFLYTVSDINIGDEVYNRIINKSYVPNDDIGLDELSYIKFLHYGYDGNSKVGELIVNKKIKDIIINMLNEFYNAKYQINSFKLVDDYFEKDDEDRNDIDRKSILDNNSYGFFYRKIYGTDRLSHHSKGFAIDINPKENPYLPFRDGKYDYSNLSKEEIEYLTHREEGKKHVIVHSDLAYKLFNDNNFEWGGDWEHTKDYQHFEVKL